MDIHNLNTTALAYIGDSVYEVYVREHVLSGGNANSDKLHKMAIKYVSAYGQAKAIKKIFDELSEEDQALVKRARNHKSASKPKNVDPMTYKWATALEALIGSYHLKGEIEKEKMLVERIISVIEEA